MTRTLDLVESEDSLDRLKLLIDNVPFAVEASISLRPSIGTSEIWCFNNTTPDTHPMHIHLISFEVLFRVRNEDHTNRIPPEPQEMGPKDVVLAYPGMNSCVQTSPCDLAGPYVVHCHILEHEDWEMMQTFEVV